MVIKLRPRIEGQYIVESIFSGADEQHCTLVCDARWHVGEYQLFGAALLLGAAQTNGQLKVIVQYPNNMKGDEFMQAVAAAGLE